MSIEIFEDESETLGKGGIISLCRDCLKTKVALGYALAYICKAPVGTECWECNSARTMYDPVLSAVKDLYTGVPTIISVDHLPGILSIVREWVKDGKIEAKLELLIWKDSGTLLTLACRKISVLK